MSYGLTFPLETVPLREQRGFVQDLEAMGYSGVWSSEAQDLDGFVPLALAAEWAPTLRVGCAVFPVQTRGPAVLAMSAASLAISAPGRFTLGIGSSSQFIVQLQNARPYAKPLSAVQDTVRFLRAALAGEKINEEYDTFTVRGFGLAREVDHPPKILVAALRQKMLELGGREADGVILNYVTPDDVRKVAPIVKQFGADKEIAGRIYVCPTLDAETVRKTARRSMAPYFSVPTYRAHQEWLGHGHYYEKMWACMAEGDFRGARAALSDEAVDRFYIHGPAEYCKERIAELMDAGLETPIIGLVEQGMDPREAAKLLAPNG